MKKKYFIDSNLKLAQLPMSNNLNIQVPSGKEVLRIESNGKITWFLNNEKIIVKEKSLLAIALLDVLVQITNLKYDYSKIDPELYKQYQEFLDIKKEEKSTP